MGLVDDLLIVLSSYHGGYKLLRRRMHGYWYERRSLRREGHAADSSLRVALSRLKRRGLVERKNGVWSITSRGVVHLARKLLYKSILSRGGSKRGPKNMIVSFDIHESKKRERELLRNALKNLGFVMLHKSVWFGPAPLPKDFIVALKRLGILPFLKFFKAEEADIV